ncbi:unnamed protein product [Dicrocoelium dendriticum]|nr:unnamed protein product [Dicrocoelium dendriticum]
MSKRSNAFKDNKEMETVMRLLDTVDEGSFRKLFSILNKRPTFLVSQHDRIESVLISMINPKETSCSQQASPHPHFAIVNTKTRRVFHMAAACLAILPTLDTGTRQPERFTEFQMRLLLCLCESFNALSELHGIPLPNVSSVKAYLASKSKPFVSLIPICRDKMPSPEYLQIVLIRAGFFVSVLRHLYELGLNMLLHVPLPLIVALFEGILSTNLSSTDKTSTGLLSLTSQLLHCLGAVIRTVGSTLMPASSLILTLLIYQLEWTACWQNGGQMFEGLVRHRLASYGCLRELLCSACDFSADRVTSLLPRILNQLIQDAMYVLNVQIGNETPKDPSRNVDAETRCDSYNIIKQRILVAALELTSEIFSNPTICTSIRLSGGFSTNNKREDDSADSIQGIARLHLCLICMIQQVTLNYSSGAPSKVVASPSSHILLHIPVLKSLSRAAAVVVRATPSSCLKPFSLLLWNTMAVHPDPYLKSFSHECLNRLESVAPAKEFIEMKAEGSPSLLCVGQTELTGSYSRESHGSATNVSSTKILLANAEGDQQSPLNACDRSLEQISCTYDQCDIQNPDEHEECSAAKRFHMSGDWHTQKDVSICSNPHESSDSQFLSASDLTHLNACLSTFDPTFA